MSYNKITFDNPSKNNVIIKVLEALMEKGFILEGVENWSHYLSMRFLNNCCKPWMVSECKITRRCEGELINNDDHHTAVHC